jgi:hypothetical protein
MFSETVFSEKVSKKGFTGKEVHERNVPKIFSKIFFKVTRKRENIGKFPYPSLELAPLECSITGNGFPGRAKEITTAG